jgi:predicted nucleic acid-binding Zn finger protein
MKDPLEDLFAGYALDIRIRNNIAGYYQARGRKALDIVDQERVRRYRDFFVVSGDTADYVVEDDFCSCSDFLHRKKACAHILAVKISRFTGRYSLIDRWYYETLMEPAGSTVMQ